jgi:hypothetical protein
VPYDPLEDASDLLHDEVVHRNVLLVRWDFSPGIYASEVESDPTWILFLCEATLPVG